MGAVPGRVWGDCGCGEGGELLEGAVGVDESGGGFVEVGGVE